MSLEQELLKIDEAFWKGGPEAYQAHADDVCLVVFSEMATKMKRADIVKTAEKGRWSDVSITPKGMAELTDASAVVTYECSARRKDGKKYHAYVSSGYVKREDGWKLSFHQQTPISQDAS
jgi:hypothetical protein